MYFLYYIINLKSLQDSVNPGLQKMGGANQTNRKTIFPVDFSTLIFLPNLLETRHVCRHVSDLNPCDDVNGVYNLISSAIDNF